MKVPAKTTRLADWEMSMKPPQPGCRAENLDTFTLPAPSTCGTDEHMLMNIVFTAISVVHAFKPTVHSCCQLVNFVSALWWMPYWNQAHQLRPGDLLG